MNEPDFQAFVVNYTPCPIATRLSSASGPQRAGTVVTVYGAHLSEPSAVHFGTKIGKNVNVGNGHLLKVTAFT
ncbi:MAG: hypothetical protein ACYDAE_29730 [Steroidobacteraceae bacterium]